MLKEVEIATDIEAIRIELKGHRKLECFVEVAVAKGTNGSIGTCGAGV